MNIPDDMVLHVGKIFAGEYECDWVKGAPVIADIGGNVGGFAVWAAYRWPASQIHSYEPVLRNFDLLQANTSAFRDRVTCYNVGVGEPGLREMYYGKHNWGECSLYRGDEQRDAGEQVRVIDPQQLPEAHLVKIDTEGAEIEILEGMTYLPFAYLIEYHSDENRRSIDRLLSDYTLIDIKTDRPNYGIVKYVRTDLL